MAMLQIRPALSGGRKQAKALPSPLAEVAASEKEVIFDDDFAEFVKTELIGSAGRIAAEFAKCQENWAQRDKFVERSGDPFMLSADLPSRREVTQVLPSELTVKSTTSRPATTSRFSGATSANHAAGSPGNGPGSPEGSHYYPSEHRSEYRSGKQSILGWEAARFELHDLWKEMLLEKEEMTVPARLLSARAMTFELQSMSSSVFSRQSLSMELPRWEAFFATATLAKHMIHPNSKRRLLWDLLGMTLVVYDIITIPLQVFEPKKNLFSTVMAWCLAVFWTVDFPTGFLTGFTQDGRLVMNPLYVGKHYMTSWMPLDLFLISLDWFLLLFADSEDSSAVATLGITRFGKAFRVVRILRVLRLLRLMKIPRYLSRVEERIESELVAVIVGIVKLTAAILLINHLVACSWYGIGVGPYRGRRNWVDVYVPEDESGPYRYTTSLHWSLTQFTPAGMEVYPSNTIERVFNIIVVIFAMVTFSWFISSITNAMTHLRNMNSDYARQLLELSRFVRFQKISSQLSLRIRRHLEHIIVKGSQEINEKDVQLFKFLSEPLRMELHVEIYSKTLMHHPLFNKFAEMNTVAMRKICHQTLSTTMISLGDCLFSWGETCDQMYFVKHGRLIYTQDKGEYGYNEVVSNGSWMCEACLWTCWRHLGWAYASTKASLLGLDGSKFLRVIRGCSSPTLQPAIYASAFLSFINKDDSTIHLREPISDLCHEGFDMEQAIRDSCLATSVRQSQGGTSVGSRRISSVVKSVDIQSSRRESTDPELDVWATYST
mmetsp:Transcript_15596/g.35798  ORF Transcript_15596/g.35798 Transcript_15596/m.35798 type:complete len:775 (-) Transcript_15596:69-2393(-)